MKFGCIIRTIPRQRRRRGSSHLFEPNRTGYFPLTWSTDTDSPVKLWNVHPLKGEFGFFFNEETNTIDVFYGNDLVAHATHLRNQVDFPVLGESWIDYPDSPTSSGVDTFGKFKVSVTHLKRPHKVYERFLRVW
jgi:hypothetical protein